jgi:hypothetical protein
VTVGTVTANSPLQGLEQSPTAFEPNGDYVVSNETACSHDRTTHPQVGLFSQAGVQDSAFSSISIAFGGEAKTKGRPSRCNRIGRSWWAAWSWWAA